MKILSKKVNQLIFALFSLISGVIILAILTIFVFTVQIVNVVGIWLLIVGIFISILIASFFYAKFFLKLIYDIKDFSKLSNLTLSLIISGIYFVISIYAPIHKPDEFIWTVLIPLPSLIIIIALFSIISILIQNVKLKELDHLKSIFLASTSHELRTPLTSIIGFTRMMLKGWVGEINEEQEKQLKIILKSANHLHKLIDDVIDVTKIEADKLEIKIDEFDLVKELIKLKDTFSIDIEKKGLEFLMDIPENLLIYNDKKRVNQILWNLIGNAIKFTDKGRILIKIQKSTGNADILVVDTGPGIREKDRENLFKPFSRIIEPRRFKEGTGLGLHISKKLANQLGGDIFVESEFGKGSIFTLSLKMKEEDISK
jgi:signal transduction histidine kinase